MTYNKTSPPYVRAANLFDGYNRSSTTSQVQEHMASFVQARTPLDDLILVYAFVYAAL